MENKLRGVHFLHHTGHPWVTNTQNNPVGPFKSNILYNKTLQHHCYRTARLYDNDVWSLLPRFPLFPQNTSGKARGCWQDSGLINDHVQQVSHRTVSSDLSLWRKQSMDCNSAQSDALSPPPYMPLSTMLENPNRLKQRRKEINVTSEAFFIRLWGFKSWLFCLFEVRRYFLGKKQAVKNVMRREHWILSKSFLCLPCFLLPYPSLQRRFFKMLHSVLYVIQLCPNMGQHFPGMRTQNWLHILTSTSAMPLSNIAENP